MKRGFHYLSLKGISVVFMLCYSLSMAQYTNELTGNVTGSLPEILWYKNLPVWENKLAAILHTDSTALQKFLQYSAPELNKDRGSFFTGFSTRIIMLDSTSQFFEGLNDKYIALYSEYVHSGQSANNPKPLLLSSGSSRSSCNPSCSNIDFQNGTLSSWSAFWAVDASTSAAINTTNVTGGPCASVTQDALDPNTSSYQVSLMPPNGADPLAGPLIPYTPPLGGTCAMVGDGPITGAGVGILEQSFTVSASNPLLTLQYAVMLENPNHPGYVQPWFQIELLDENGNDIPGCGQYLVVSGPGLPGFIPLTYAPGGDTVYCQPWTTAFVPLGNYIGQCVTVIFTASDCSLGGHYGYAYVAASCGQISLSSSSTVFCTGQQSATITGPPGGANYQWTTTDGCISGSSTQQVLQVTCAGTYSLVASSSAGAQCVDTLSITIPASSAGPPPVACFTIADTICAGDSLHIDASCSGLNSGTKYYWDFFDNGNYEDSSGINPQWNYASAGNYNIRLHEVAANGCSADTVMQTVVESTSDYGLPSISLSTTNASTCSSCDGGITMSLSLSSVTVGISITNSCNASVIQYSPNGSARLSNACGSLSLGAGHITTKCTGLCPETCLYYITPLVPVPPTKCAPGGFSGDTIAANVGVNGVTLAVSQNITPATCGKNNGSASITVSGGTAPYTYTWPSGLGSDSSVTGLAEGSYMVTVTDFAGCDKSFNVVINSSGNLPVTVVPYYVNCFGANNGAIKVTPAGNSIYTYQWLPNVSTGDSAGGLAPGNYSITVTDTSGCSNVVSASIIQPTQITDTITGNYANLPCYTTGYATVNATGGFAPYTFSWNNGVHLATDTGLTSGVYTITITDANQCSIKDMVSVKVSGGIDTASVSIIPADSVLVCGNSTVSFTAIGINGGTTPLYQWQVNGNNAGTDSNGFSSDSLRNGDIVICILTSSLACVTGSPATSNAVKVKVFPVFQAQIISAGSGSICEGTSEILTVPDDSVALQWQSSNTEGDFEDVPGATDSSYTSTPNQTTYFRVYAPNSNCPDTSGIFELMVKPAPAPPALTATDSIFCAGDSALVCVPDTFASYRWNTGDTVSCTTAKQAGGYWVTVTPVNGCSVVSTHQEISVYPVQSVSIIEQGDTLSSFGAVSYQWILDGTPISNATGATYVAQAGGSYSVAVTDTNGCTTISNAVVITGIGDLLEENVLLYPNPTAAGWRLVVGSELIGSAAEIYDDNGRMVFQSIIRNPKSEIDLNVARGIYWLHISGPTISLVKKMIKL